MQKLIFVLFFCVPGFVNTPFSQKNINNSLRYPNTGYSDSMHLMLDSLLQAYVNPAGQVNYKGLQNDLQRLNTYCLLLAEKTPDEQWSREAQMAYWINAYNAFTLQLVANNYPAKSIMRFDAGKTWDVRRITLQGKKYSLNEIENQILRPKFNDARVHFALNCAAKSCPPLYNRAFTSENLHAVLDQRTRLFINNPRFNSLGKKSVRVSKIFDWYKADFGDLRKFLNQYADKPVSAKAAITFNEYDWDLNE